VNRRSGSAKLLSGLDNNELLWDETFTQGQSSASSSEVGVTFKMTLFPPSCSRMPLSANNTNHPLRGDPEG
jgi:hypothetical protein